MIPGTASGSKEGDFARALGERIRAVRRARGLTLTEVQAISRDELKASVLGAYERGKRAISITRLQRLASLYGVPVAALLPGAPVVAGEGGQFVFDLAWLLVADGPEAEVLRRYLAQLQVERGGLNGRVLSVRAEDLRAVAWVLGIDEAALRDRLIELGTLSTGHHA